MTKVPNSDDKRKPHSELAFEYAIEVHSWEVGVRRLRPRPRFCKRTTAGRDPHAQTGDTKIDDDGNNNHRMYDRVLRVPCTVMILKICTRLSRPNYYTPTIPSGACNLRSGLPGLVPHQTRSTSVTVNTTFCIHLLSLSEGLGLCFLSASRSLTVVVTDTNGCIADLGVSDSGELTDSNLGALPSRLAEYNSVATTVETREVGTRECLCRSDDFPPLVLFGALTTFIYTTLLSHDRGDNVASRADRSCSQSSGRPKLRDEGSMRNM